MRHNTSTNVLPAHSGVARFMDACNHRQPDATPVWFMRQAGRCLAEYRELRKRYDILTMARTPELCAQVTLMPVNEFGVDGAVLYADIMLPLEGMGVSLEIQPEIGPIIHNPIRTMQDVEKLRVPEAEESTPYVLEAIRLVRHELEGKQAVLGFSGAPFTLACYLIEGRPSRDYGMAKSLMYGQPEVWHALMEKLTEVTIRYLVAQAKAGVNVVQLFDSWVGALSPSAYRTFVFPYTQRIFQAVKETGTPSIHFVTSTGTLLETMAEAGGGIKCVGLRFCLGDAWKSIGDKGGLPGKLGPALFLAPSGKSEEGVKGVFAGA